MKHSSTFRVDNVFRWVIEARDAGFSREDIQFVLKTLDWLEPMQKILEESEETTDGNCDSRDPDAA